MSHHTVVVSLSRSGSTKPLNAKNQEESFTPQDFGSKTALEAHEAFIKSMAEQEMSEMDTNNDGVVDEQEFLAAGGSKEEFERYDLNGDGVIDKGEMVQRARVIHVSGAGPAIGVARQAQEVEDVALGMHTAYMERARLESESSSSSDAEDSGIKHKGGVSETDQSLAAFIANGTPEIEVTPSSSSAGSHSCLASRFGTQ